MGLISRVSSRTYRKSSLNNIKKKYYGTLNLQQASKEARRPRHRHRKQRRLRHLGHPEQRRERHQGTTYAVALGRREGDGRWRSQRARSHGPSSTGGQLAKDPDEDCARAREEVQRQARHDHWPAKGDGEGGSQGRQQRLQAEATNQPKR